MSEPAERHDRSFCSPFTSGACWTAGADEDMLVCEGCGDQIDSDTTRIDFNGEDWHEACFEVRSGPRYCCGAMYTDGEDTCLSCGEPL